MKDVQINRNSFLLSLGKKMTIVGSDYIALDCARIGVRAGKDVRIIFEKSEDDFHADAKDIEQAKEEGVVFEALTKPIEILSGETNTSNGVRCIRMDYADVEENGNWQLIPVEDSEIVLDADFVVVSGQHKPNTTVSRWMPELKLTQEGALDVDDATGLTSVEGVFAPAAKTSGLHSVVQAIAHGKKSAENIHRFLK